MTDEPGGDFDELHGRGRPGRARRYEIGPQQRAFLHAGTTPDTGRRHCRRRGPQRLRPGPARAAAATYARRGARPRSSVGRSASPSVWHRRPTTSAHGDRGGGHRDGRGVATTHRPRPESAEPGYFPQHAVPEPPRRSEAEQPGSTRATPSRPSSSARATGSRTPPRSRWPRRPAKAYNPLFVYGESGLGKTHLLHAIGHYARKIYPGTRVRYVSSRGVHQRLHQLDPRRQGLGVPAPLPRRRRPAHRRHPVPRGQGPDAGGVLPHLQHAAQRQQADRHHLRPAAQAAVGARGPAAQPVRVGPDHRRPAARPRDPDRDPVARRPTRTGSTSRPTCSSTSPAGSPPTSASSRAP